MCSSWRASSRRTSRRRSTSPTRTRRSCTSTSRPRKSRAARSQRQARCRSGDWTRDASPASADDGRFEREEMPGGIAFNERRPAHGSLRITGLDGAEREIATTAFPLFGPDERVPRDHGHLLGGIGSGALEDLGLPRLPRHARARETVRDGRQHDLRRDVGERLPRHPRRRHRHTRTRSRARRGAGRRRSTSALPTCTSTTSRGSASSRRSTTRSARSVVWGPPSSVRTLKERDQPLPLVAALPDRGLGSAGAR